MSAERLLMLTRVVISAAAVGVMLALFGLAGWVEGGCGGQC